MCNLLRALQSELSFIVSAFTFNDLCIWGRQIKDEWRSQNTEPIFLFSLRNSISSNLSGKSESSSNKPEIKKRKH